VKIHDRGPAAYVRNWADVEATLRRSPFADMLPRSTAAEAAPRAAPPRPRPPAPPSPPSRPWRPARPAPPAPEPEVEEPPTPEEAAWAPPAAAPAAADRAAFFLVGAAAGVLLARACARGERRARATAR
jgi:hypothetical protein